MPINILVGLLSGPMPAALAELYPTQVRSSGVGLIYNLVGAVFGGLGPLIITWLIATTGNRASPAYWAMATRLVGIVAILSLRKTGIPRDDRAAPAVPAATPTPEPLTANHETP